MLSKRCGSCSVLSGCDLTVFGAPALSFVLCSFAFEQTHERPKRRRVHILMHGTGLTSTCCRLGRLCFMNWLPTWSVWLRAFGWPGQHRLPTWSVVFACACVPCDRCDRCLSIILLLSPGGGVGRADRPSHTCLYPPRSIGVLSPARSAQHTAPGLVHSSPPTRSSSRLVHRSV